MSCIEDNDEDMDSEEFFGGKEALVFLIDGTEPMFDCQQFSLAIQCIESVMKNKAIASPSDELAVILFGTDKTSNYESFEHIFIVQNLTTAGVESILQLKDLKECDFGSKFGHNSRFSLDEVFTLAIQELTKRKTTFDVKRVILFTNTSDPYSGDSSEDKLREKALIRAKSFDTYNIGFELIPLASRDDKPFDVHTFYGEAFPHLKDDKFNASEKLESLLRRIHRPFHKQRVLASIPFRFGDQTGKTIPEVKISVNFYDLYKEAKKPATVRLNRNDLKKVKSDTSFTTQDSGEKVLSQEVSKSYSFGYQRLVLTKDDDNIILAFEDPALTLLGFKPRTALLSHIHIRPGHFIFPNESDIKGSTTLFTALLKRCAERDRIPICRLTLNKGKPPRLVALYPQIESKPLGRYGGFHVIYLPFKEDIRELDIKNADQLPVRMEALELATNIVNNLTFNFEPKNFPNPVLQTYWRTIEGLALNQTIEPFDDRQTQPDYEYIESKAGYDMYSLNQMLGAYAVQPIQKKAVKVYEDLSDMTNKNQLGTLTVPELKEFCRLKNISCGSKKAEVMAAIRSYYKK